MKKINISKIVGTGLLAAFLAVGFHQTALAEAANQSAAVQTSTRVFYYSRNYQATNKHREETRKGNTARTYYDNSRRKWAVEVRYGTNTTDGDWSADGGKLPNGASIIYFPTKSSAEGIYKSSLAQGDWAKMWYDQKRGSWAVAVKPGGRGSGGASTRTTTTTRRTTTTTRSTTRPAKTATNGSGQLPNGATVVYFPTKEMADGIYKAHLRQGDWAKMWYDAGRGDWAVAIKPRL